MKKLILAVGLLVSVPSFANSIETVFRADSPLSVVLRTRILMTLKARCPEGLSWNGLKEISTTVNPVSIDQGQTDYFYETEFDTRYNFDGAHPVHATIRVKSAEYDISNPAFDRLDILGVAADAPICSAN